MDFGIQGGPQTNPHGYLETRDDCTSPWGGGAESPQGDGQVRETEILMERERERL